MISDAKIHGLKGISECGINNLSRINLLIGKNNTCKSTILEGLYYALKEFTGSHLAEILARRTNVTFGARELWYNYQTDKEIGIDLHFQGAQLGLGLSFDKERNVAATNLTVTDEIANKGYSSMVSEYSSNSGQIRVIRLGIDMFDPLPPENRATIRSYAQNCSFLESSGRKDVASLEELLGERFC